MKRKQARRLRFTAKGWQRARRIRRSVKSGREKRNQRVGVEATVRSLKHPFPAGKLPVRGRFRVVCMVIGVAAAVNMRRLHRFLHSRFRLLQGQEGAGAGRKQGQERLGESVLRPLFSLIQAVQALCKSIVTFRPSDCVVFGW